MGEVLVDTLNKFPTYDLQSQQGFEVAIRDIEHKLSSVASFHGEEEIATILRSHKICDSHSIDVDGQNN